MRPDILGRVKTRQDRGVAFAAALLALPEPLRNHEHCRGDDPGNAVGASRHRHHPVRPRPVKARATAPPIRREFNEGMGAPVVRRCWWFDGAITMPTRFRRFGSGRSVLDVRRTSVGRPRRAFGTHSLGSAIDAESDTRFRRLARRPRRPVDRHHAGIADADRASRGAGLHLPPLNGAGPASKAAADAGRGPRGRPASARVLGPETAKPRRAPSAPPRTASGRRPSGLSSSCSRRLAHRSAVLGLPEYDAHPWSDGDSGPQR